jgi:RHS repeat-associated protein
VVFTYTPTGQRATVTDDRGLTTYRYDERDRLVSRTDPDGTSISYTYDLASNRTSVTTPAGTTVYTFDALNRPDTVTDPALGVTRYTYDAASNLVRTELPNGTVELRQYDALNRLVYLENDGPAGVISSYRYTLGPTGRRDAVVENTGRRVDYGYDALDRLTREAISDAVFGNRTIDYTYDPVGNRVTRNDSTEGLTVSTYDANDRLLTETLGSQVTRYTYDDNGNTLSKVTSATNQAFYHWDAQNRMVSADVTDGTGTHHTDYRYDADGIRVAQTADGQETRYLIDTVQPYAQVLLEYRPSGLVVASYVYGNGLISQNRAGVLSYYHVDGLGSTRALTNANGVVTDRYVYDAFGRTISQTGSTVNTYLFAGQQRDAATGLDYLRARYLTSGAGTFLGRDSFPGMLNDPLSLGRYLYANANPINRIDPSGLQSSLSEVQVGLGIENILGSLGRPALTQLGKAIAGKADFIAAMLAAFGFLAINYYTGLDSGFYKVQAPFPIFSIDSTLEVSEKVSSNPSQGTKNLSVDFAIKPRKKLAQNTTQAGGTFTLQLVFQNGKIIDVNTGLKGTLKTRLINYPSQNLAFIKVDAFAEAGYLTSVSNTFGSPSGFSYSVKSGLEVNFLGFAGIKGGFDFVTLTPLFEFVPPTLKLP